MNIVLASVARDAFKANQTIYTFQSACEAALQKIVAAANIGLKEEAEVPVDQDFFMLNKSVCSHILNAIEAAGWTVRTTDVDGIDMIITFSFEI